MIWLARLSGAKLVSMRQCSGPGPGLVFLLFNCHQILGYWFAIACRDARNFLCVSFIFDIRRLDEATYGFFKTSVSNFDYWVRFDSIQYLSCCTWNLMVFPTALLVWPHRQQFGRYSGKSQVTARCAVSASLHRTGHASYSRRYANGGYFEIGLLTRCNFPSILLN